MSHACLSRHAIFETQAMSPKAQSSVVASPSCLRIAIVEDDPAIHQSVINAINDSVESGHPSAVNAPKIELCWSAFNLAEAQAQLKHQVDLLLLDLGLPDGRGVSLLPALRQMQPVPIVIAFTTFSDEATVIEAIEAGVDGYLLKSAERQSLLDTLHCAVAGESPISPSVAGYLLRRLRRDEVRPAPAAVKPTDRVMSLTPRERDVLEALARGLSYRDVAEKLHMSTHTVSHHVKNLYPKLASTSRSEAIFKAVQDGLISMEPKGN
jgi:DNA-binding NarL/FixJ family response regulator